MSQAVAGPAGEGEGAPSPEGDGAAAAALASTEKGFVAEIFVPAAPAPVRVASSPNAPGSSRVRAASLGLGPAPLGSGRAAVPEEEAPRLGVSPV